MTIKQYGGLTLDLNTVKEFKLEYNYEYPEGIRVRCQKFHGDLIGHSVVLSLFDGNIITINDKWHVQFTKDYQEFTLLKVIKEAFDSVFDNKFEIKKDSKIYELSSTKFWCKIWDNGEFAFAKDSSITGELPRFYAAHCLSDWIRYAQQIKDKYLDSIVNPVKMANQVLKSRKEGSEWVAQRNINGKNLVLASNKERLSFYPSTLGKLTIWAVIVGNIEGNVSMNYPTTNSEWVKAIEFALDKYYDLNKVDPSEIAKEVLESRKLNTEWVSCTSTPVFKLNLANIEGDSIIVWQQTGNYKYRVCNHRKCEEYFKRSPKTKQDWVSLINEALDKYYDSQQVNLKLMLGKALKDNGLVAEIVSIFYCEKSLYANVSIHKNKSIQWVKSLDGTIDVYLLTTNNKEAFLSYSTANVEDWQTIFSDSLARYKKLITPEPTLLDLIKQAFPNYKFYYKAHISESGNFICYGFHNSITLEVAYNPKLNLIELFTVKERGESGEYYFSKSRDFFTKENLTNYTNWEQWLEELIKVNQNLKDLEQSPNLVVKAMKQLPQRVSNLPTSTRPTLTELEDPWECD